MVERKIKFKKDVIHNLGEVGMENAKGGTLYFITNMGLDVCAHTHWSEWPDCFLSTYPWCDGPNPTNWNC